MKTFHERHGMSMMEWRDKQEAQRKHVRCRCGFRIRGAGHYDGVHHLKGKGRGHDYSKR